MFRLIGKVHHVKKGKQAVVLTRTVPFELLDLLGELLPTKAVYAQDNIIYIQDCPTMERRAEQRANK